MYGDGDVPVDPWSGVSVIRLLEEAYRQPA
jgi:hypothetical protein